MIGGLEHHNVIDVQSTKHCCREVIYVGSGNVEESLNIVKLTELCCTA